MWSARLIRRLECEWPFNEIRLSDFQSENWFAGVKVMVTACRKETFQCSQNGFSNLNAGGDIIAFNCDFAPENI